MIYLKALDRPKSEANLQRNVTVNLDRTMQRLLLFLLAPSAFGSRATSWIHARIYATPEACLAKTGVVELLGAAEALNRCAIHTHSVSAVAYQSSQLTVRTIGGASVGWERRSYTNTACQGAGAVTSLSADYTTACAGTQTLSLSRMHALWESYYLS